MSTSAQRAPSRNQPFLATSLKNGVPGYGAAMWKSAMSSGSACGWAAAGAGAKRAGGKDPQREIDQTGARRAPVPAEYKASWEALTKSLSKKNTPGKKDAEKTRK